MVQSRGYSIVANDRRGLGFVAASVSEQVATPVTVVASRIPRLPVSDLACYECLAVTVAGVTVYLNPHRRTPRTRRSCATPGASQGIYASALRTLGLVPYLHIGRGIYKSFCTMVQLPRQKKRPPLVRTEERPRLGACVGRRVGPSFPAPVARPGGAPRSTGTHCSQWEACRYARHAPRSSRHSAPRIGRTRHSAGVCRRLPKRRRGRWCGRTIRTRPRCQWFAPYQDRGFRGT